MEQIFVANPKGGCGKTTVSTQLAAYLAIQGKRVLLADHDALKCSSDWLASRPADCAKISSVSGDIARPVPIEDIDWVIHDMPAAWSVENVQDILYPGDRVLIPVLPSPNDIKAGLRFIMRLHRSGVLESGVRAGLIANRTRTRTVYFKVLETFLQRLNLPIITVLRDTQNYVRVMDAGLSIFDLPSNKFDRDVAQWQALFEWLHKPKV